MQYTSKYAPFQGRTWTNGDHSFAGFYPWGSTTWVLEHSDSYYILATAGRCWCSSVSSLRSTLNQKSFNMFQSFRCKESKRQGQASMWTTRKKSTKKQSKSMHPNLFVLLRLCVDLDVISKPEELTPMGAFCWTHSSECPGGGVSMAFSKANAYSNSRPVQAFRDPEASAMKLPKE